MQNISSLLVTIFGIVIFIWLLPALLWLLAIIILLVVVFVFYQKYKVNQYLKNNGTQFNQEEDTTYTYTQTHSTNQTEDIIDVEFSERDDVS